MSFNLKKFKRSKSMLNSDGNYTFLIQSNIIVERGGPRLMLIGICHKPYLTRSFRKEYFWQDTGLPYQKLTSATSTLCN